MMLFIIGLIAGIGIGAFLQSTIDCKHQWKIIDKVMVDTDYGARWQRYFLQCEKCGQVKSKNMR